MTEAPDKDTFVFPDEETGQSTTVEIIDDTPEQDRGRKPMTEAPEDPSDAELATYSESVKQRIKHFTKGYHDERRNKEAAARERDEAVRVAQALVVENKRLLGSMEQGQAALLEQAKRVVAKEYEEAKNGLRAAQESYDTDQIVNAQEALMNAKMKVERVNNFKPAPLQPQQPVVQPQQSAPPVDPKAQQWLTGNKWFGEDEEMTSFAMGVHNKLVKNGVDPRSDDYYERLNSRMREKFSEQFDDSDAQPVRRQSNNVASAKRSTAPKKIVLTQTQVSLARRLNVPLEEYARQVALESRK